MPLVSLEVEDVFWAVLEDLNLEEASNAPPMLYVIVLHVLRGPFQHVTNSLRSAFYPPTQSPTPFLSNPPPPPPPIPPPINHLNRGRPRSNSASLALAEHRGRKDISSPAPTHDTAATGGTHKDEKEIDSVV